MGETLSSISSKTKKNDIEEEPTNRYSGGGDMGLSEALEPEVLLAILNSNGRR